MQTIPFGKTGLHVALVAIGATDNVEVINMLLDAGANLVDTAQCYGEHEVFLADSIGHRRHEFILQSKCGHHDVLPDGSMRSRAISMLDIDRALLRLRTDYLDIMLLHSYDYDLLEEGTAVAVLAEAKKAGKIRFAGYSGDNESAALAATLPDLDVLELSISIADQHNIDAVLPAARTYGKGVVAKRPVSGGAWRFISEPNNTKNAPYSNRLREMALDLPSLGFPATHEAWSELALRFNLSFADLHTSILGTKNLAHAQAYLDASEQGPLPKEVLEAVRAAFTNAEHAFGSVWRGQN